MSVPSYRLTELALLWLFVALPLSAWTPGFHLRSQCGQVITGGSSLSVIYSDYDGETIAIHSLEDGSSRTVLAVENPFYDVQLSPSCRWVSFNKYDRQIEKSTVRIISRAGVAVKVLRDARFHVWGTDASGADCLAYIVGEDTEENGYQSHGTWLLNVETGEERQIHERGHQLAWAEFDQSFYIGDWPNSNRSKTTVGRFNVETNELEETPYHGIDFSPDGRYYHTRSDGGEGLKVYLRASNEEIGSRYEVMLERFFNGNPNFWLNTSMIVFGSYRRMNVKNRIIDFDRYEGWEVEEELVGFADEEEKNLLLLVDGKVTKRSFEEAARLIYPLPEVPEEAKLGGKEGTGEN